MSIITPAFDKHVRHAGVPILWEINYNRTAIMHREGGVSREIAADVAHVLAESKSVARAAFEARFPEAQDISITRLLLIDVIAKIT
jgi:hypothetical protein